MANVVVGAVAGTVLRRLLPLSGVEAVVLSIGDGCMNPQAA